ncbi:MAG: TetR family transcriptional regulator C-terminal domain-containing protein [Pseudomonadales bacterium]
MAKNPGTRRAAPKEVRRQQLIKATLKTVANNGLAGTTMALVTKEAGLSIGIVNLHFQSKEKLFIETLQFLSDEYMSGWNTILDNSALSATEKIKQVIDFDFSPKVTQRSKLAVWYAFWGEAKSRPTYNKICAAQDRSANLSLIATLEQLITDGDYADVDSDLVATGYLALANGLWLDLLMTPKVLSREKAQRICADYMRSHFINHF